MQEESSAEAQLKHEIVCTICEALMLLDLMEGSLNDFEDVLDYTKKSFCTILRSDLDLTKYWPKNWRETEKLLKEYGYQSPKELFVCLSESHFTHWDVMEDPNALCRYCGKKGSIKYYYLGLSDEIRTWFSDSSMCKKMLAHWINTENWIGGEGANDILKEVWDGSRFNELAWFWDPDSKWMLPHKCNLCGDIISVDKIRSSRKCNEEQKNQIKSTVFNEGNTGQYFN